MPKIEITIKEKKDSDSCSVKLEVKNTDKAIQYFNYSSVLIDSLCELLYIYYERHELEKVYYYKSLIENHKLYNGEYKKIIEYVLDKIKTKKSLDITF